MVKWVAYERLSPTWHKLHARYGPCQASWETDRVMVPVEKLRNPLAGRRSWSLTLRCGRLTGTWRWQA